MNAGRTLKKFVRTTRPKMTLSVKSRQDGPETGPDDGNG